mmetsp:Transcript_16079/g.35299  ORF Transcript_16079/g.35299 Transcript_16079/m.35299 type:complete len:253 (-) Transcript_16079:53-811(-)
MIWFAGLKTAGQKSGSSSMTGSHFPVFCTTNRGSRYSFIQSSSRLRVMIPMELFAPTISLSSPTFVTRQSHGILRKAKKRTSGPKTRCAKTWIRPWAKIVPTAVFCGSMCRRMFSKISLVVLTGPVQSTMSDSGISSAGSSETLSTYPSCTVPHGKTTRGRLPCQTSGRLVKICVRTRPFVLPSNKAAQTWPLLPDAIKVTTILPSLLLPMAGPLHTRAPLLLADAEGEEVAPTGPGQTCAVRRLVRHICPT